MLPLLLPGIKINTSPTNYFPISQAQLSRFDGKSWQLIGGVLGRASYTDFLVFAEQIKKLEGGIVLNFGTAVMGPEVYLKALAMARNVAHQSGERIAKFTTAVFDLIPLGDDYHTQAPKTDPRYYYRPWKTILVRTVADGGESFYVQGDHRVTVPHVWRAAIDAERQPA